MLSEPIKTFLRDLGLLLHIPAVLFIPTLFVIIHFEEYFALPGFLIMAMVSLFFGQLLYRSFKNNEKEKRKYSLAMVSLSWLIIPLLGAIPFYGISVSASEVIGEAEKFSDGTSAIFESMSGFTSTGLSMLDKPETIPHCLQWWRSVSEWLGGIGVIILAISVFDISTKANILYEAEAMNWIIDDSGLKKTIRAIWIIYILYTIGSILLFYLAGMPGWEAINHGLTAVCTGGFTIIGDSYISYNHYIKWIAIFIMFIGSLSFQIHYLLLFKRNFKKVVKLTELKVYGVILILIFLIINLLNSGEDFTDNIFQATSALGTCGFNSVETPSLPVPVIFLLSLAMIMGGNSSSTTGGLKTRKLVWIFKGIIKSFRNIWTREGSKTDHYLTFNEEEVKEEEAKEQILNSAYIFILWFTAITMGVLLTLIIEGDNYSMYQIFFDVSSALNNVGLSAGVTGYDMNRFTKWIFIVLMWIGRVEIYGCLLLIFSPFYFLRHRGNSREE